MKKTLVFVTLCVSVAATFTGCTDFSNPRSVILTAGYAVSVNDLVTFREALTGEARKRFGNVAGMKQLKKEFAGVKKLSTGYAVPLTSSNTGVFTYKTYEISAFDGERRLATASVNCVTEKMDVTPRANPAAPRVPDLDRSLDRPKEERKFMDWTTCKIAELQLK